MVRGNIDRRLLCEWYVTYLVKTTMANVAETKSYCYVFYDAIAHLV